MTMGRHSRVAELQRLADNKKPHPARSPKVAQLRCLGAACGHKLFWSSDPKTNRLCPNCRMRSDSFVSNGIFGSDGQRFARSRAP
jgi:hypothetical protein